MTQLNMFLEGEELTKFCWMHLIEGDPDIARLAYRLLETKTIGKSCKGYYNYTVSYRHSRHQTGLPNLHCKMVGRPNA